MERARTHTFVCYAHDDPDVFEDVQELKSLGARLWIDERISPGSVWRSKIVEALDSSERVLYFVSGRSVNSSHCQREISYAIHRDIPITPVILEPTEYPADQRLYLHRLQAIDRTKLRRDKYLEALESAVSLRLAPEHTDVEVPLKDPAITANTRSRPSIAVEPLVHLSRDESEVSLAISDTIVGGIADFGAWRVTKKEGGTPTYRLTGTVQTTEQITCVRVSLAASGGETIWSQQFDYESDLDPLILQNRAGWEIAFRTIREMSNHHARVARGLQPADLTADDHFHLGLSQLEGVEPNSMVAAEHFKRATQLDGAYASPLWGQAHVELEAMKCGGEVDTLEHHAVRALELTRRLLMIDPMSEISANTHARALWFSGRHDEAIVHLKRYSSMRDLPATRSLLALILAANLDHAEAAINLQRARDLFGTYPPAALLAVGIVPFAAGDYVTAAAHFRSLASAWPDPEAHVFLISALAGSNEPEAAERAYKKYTRQFPDVSTRQRLNLFGWCYPRFIDTMRRSLIESGWDGTT